MKTVEGYRATQPSGPQGEEFGLPGNELPVSGMNPVRYNQLVGLRLSA